MVPDDPSWTWDHATVTTTPSPAGPLDTAAAAAFWRDYAATRPHTVGPGDEYEVGRLGESRGQADELLGRVRHGAVRATAELVADLAHRGAALPRLGTCRVVCDGRGTPALVLRTVELRLATFREVDADVALDMGHGDLRSWREQHRADWERTSAARGAVWSDSDEIVLERFRVVWPDELAD
jgi:uncharacterized protein YhfF